MYNIHSPWGHHPVAAGKGSKNVGSLTSDTSDYFSHQSEVDTTDCISHHRTGKHLPDIHTRISESYCKKDEDSEEKKTLDTIDSQASMSMEDVTKTSQSTTEPIITHVNNPEVYESPRRRMLTFSESYHGKIAATQCSSAGFICKGESSLECPWCGLIVDVTGSAVVDMTAYHKSTSPRCEFVKGIPLPLGEANHSALQEGEETDSVVVTYQESDMTLGSAAAAGATEISSNNELYVSTSDKVFKKALHDVRGHSESSPKSHQEGKQAQSSRWRSFKRVHSCGTMGTRRLAADGFYLHTNADGEMDIRCTFCQLCYPFTASSASDCQFVDKVMKDHSSSQCRFIRGEKVRNIPDVLDDSIWSAEGSCQQSNDIIAAGDKHILGINYNQAAHPEMAVSDRRKETFLTLPPGFVKSVEDLCETGCFYSGGNHVTCFSCNTEFSNFDHSEDVWCRHARSAPNCIFVKHQKGQDFINRAIERRGEYTPPPVEPKISNITTRMLRPRMDSPPVVKALQMGLSREDVRSAIGRRIKNGEQDFRWTAEIVKAVEEAKVPPHALKQSIKLPTLISPPLKHQIQTEQGEEVEKVKEVGAKEPELVEVAMVVDSVVEDEPLPIANPMQFAQQIKSQLTCKICLSDIVGIIFIPCGHLVCCTVCSAAMSACPMCRKTVSGTIKANF